MKLIGALVCALILAVASYFWFSEAPPAINKEVLLFNPPVGDVRYFAVDQTTEIGVSGRGGSVNRMTSVLRSEVLGVEAGMVELQSAALKVVERGRGRTLVDTESGEPQSSGEKLLVDFLRSGVVEQVSVHGVLKESTYQNPDALKSISDRPDSLQTLLLRSLSVFPWYPGQFPNEDLAIGLSWQTENQEWSGGILEGMQFEVTQLDSQTVTLEFGPVGEQDQPADEDATPNSFSATGYLELERAAGWPRQASVQISTEEEHQGVTFQITSRWKVRQSEVDPGPDTDRLLSMAKISMQARPVDTSNTVFNDYFTPPFSPEPVETSLNEIQQTLLWFGTEPVDYRYGRAVGVESKLNSSNLQTATIHPVNSVRLLDADGEPVVENTMPNPDFRVLKPSIGGNAASARMPFLRMGMTDEQLRSIDVIEFDAQVTVPDQEYSVLLDKKDKAIELENAGLKLIIEEWRDEMVRIRVSETGGTPPGARPMLMGYPVDESGEPVAQFGLRMTHSAFESVLGAMKNPPRGAKAMAATLMQGLEAMPPHERNGDFIFEFSRTSAPLPDRFRFNYMSTRTKDMTFIAPAARKNTVGDDVESS
ncbi:hypothetical protein Q673_12685 [Marinobacter sp. EN3]|jgi:hypothetical protein|uniref:hypothetical protein n=1 Tax=Marinobacter sp. EN3 TaxID=1397533 RepID=UPI0003B7F109|nr:hypothetical protein [Marinobacter sp. EN3]ERS10439.1 hypothetical protein Q673_12685 [Marinobacter sp. EN3]